MNDKARAEGVLKALGYDFHHFSIGGFISFVSEAKKRQIITIPWNMPSTLFGAWMSDGEEPKEYIFYRDDVPLIHQVHIQLHELSHFLLGHPTLLINRKRLSQLLERKASLPFDELPRLRSSENSEYETQAETLAALIQKHVIKSSSIDQLLDDLSSEHKLASFLQVMGLS
jgi:hypothetical protein